MASGIYRIKNVENGHSYIGSAKNIAGRWRSHLNTLRTRKKSPPKLQKAWDKYGEAAFVFEVVELCAVSDLLTREQFYIDSERPYYNTRKEARSNIGIRWSAETNAKKAAAFAKYTVNGVTGSVKSLTEHFGVVSYGTAWTRVNRGCSVEYAVLTPVVSKQEIGRRAAKTHKRNGTHPLEKPMTAFGVTAPFRVLVSMFSTMGVKSVRQRILRGASLEDALTTPKRVW